jgi:hypothetical protein
VDWFGRQLFRARGFDARGNYELKGQVTNARIANGAKEGSGEAALAAFRGVGRGWVEWVFVKA